MWFRCFHRYDVQTTVNSNYRRIDLRLRLQPSEEEVERRLSFFFFFLTLYITCLQRAIESCHEFPHRSIKLPRSLSLSLNLKLSCLFLLFSRPLFSMFARNDTTGNLWHGPKRHALFVKSELAQVPNEVKVSSKEYAELRYSTRVQPLCWRARARALSSRVVIITYRLITYVNDLNKLIYQEQALISNW